MIPYPEGCPMQSLAVLERKLKAETEAHAKTMAELRQVEAELAAARKPKTGLYHVSTTLEPGWRGILEDYPMDRKGMP